MKVKLLSDLHIFSKHPFSYIDNGEDICVLAGDIAEGLEGIEWAKDNIPKHIKILYIPGNHEYYCHDYTSLNEEFQKIDIPNIHILLNDSIIIGNILFVGTTLWTDFNLYNTQDISAIHWRQGLNDFRYITDGKKDISSKKFIDWNTESLQYLQNCKNENPPDIRTKVLLTHYCPELSLDPQWENHPLTPGFLTKIPLNTYEYFDWHFHGHTHSDMEYQHPTTNTKVRCNPRGFGKENTLFDSQLVIDI